jgi:hypothetical protein
MWPYVRIGPTAKKKERIVIKVRMIRKAWLRFAQALGTVQMVILLTLVYIVVLTPMAILLKFLDDPFHQRGPHKMLWLHRATEGSSLSDMKRQG